MRRRPTPPVSASLAELLARPAAPAIPVAILPHAQAVPLGVLVRGTLEWLLDDSLLESLLTDHAPEQYTRELTMAALVKLLIQVSAGVRASVFAAFKADQATDEPSITTSFQALYAKLGRTNPAFSEALVRASAARLEPLLTAWPAAADEPVPGYRLRVLDGNVLAGTDHRLKALRRWLNACLPGKSLVVYEPGLGLVTDLVLCADAYTQERALLTQLLPRVQANDLWVADRNFCTTRFVRGVLRQRGFVLVRQHGQNLPWEPLHDCRLSGTTAAGEVWEQSVRVIAPEAEPPVILRRIELRLLKPTRGGDTTVAVLTNLPPDIAAVQIAETYRLRWTIETHFQFLTTALHCEVQGLGQPRAALLLFALALVAGNAVAAVRGSLRAAHGRTAAAEVSGYYLAVEMAGDYRTLMKYLPSEQWTGWRVLTAPDLRRVLTTVATSVRLAALTRNPRGPKKPPAVKPLYNKRHRHYSSARLLEEDDSC